MYLLDLVDSDVGRNAARGIGFLGPDGDVAPERLCFHGEPTKTAGRTQDPVSLSPLGTAQTPAGVLIISAGRFHTWRRRSDLRTTRFPPLVVSIWSQSCSFIAGRSFLQETRKLQEGNGGSTNRSQSSGFDVT